MKVLMHVCCGPCTGYPLTVLREEGITASATGHIQVFSDKAEDDLAIFGQMGAALDIGELSDFETIDAELSKRDDWRKQNSPPSMLPRRRPNKAEPNSRPRSSPSAITSSRCGRKKPS